MPSEQRPLKERLLEEARDTGRSIVGALLLGLPLLYTMETWWLAWRLPMWILIAYALVGLALVSVVVRYVGFHESERTRKGSAFTIARDMGEMVLHTLVTAFLFLLLFGIIDADTTFDEGVRLVTIHIVPLALGSAIANRALQSADEKRSQSTKQVTLAKESAAFVVGALFFTLPVAPTEEMELMAAHAAWMRLAIVPIASVLLIYLTLYELEFRGSAGRSQMYGARRYQVGEVFAAYALALLVAAALLGAYGHFLLDGWQEAVQKTVVLSFLASIGGSAARVVI